MTTNKYEGINALLITILVFVLFAGVMVYAQTDNKYTTLAPLPNTTSCGADSGTNCTADLTSYLPGIFNLSIGIAAVLAFVMITYGGILYMTTDAISGKTQGREYITNALWGLLLVIGAYVILYTINPQILNFNLILEKPKIVAPEAGAEVVMTPYCPTCVDLTTGGQLSVHSSGKGATSALKSKLINLDNSLRSAGIGWYISEDFPPEHEHTSACHYDGTCVDANINNATATNINSFLQKAWANSFSATYEVLTQADMDSWVAQGVPASSISVNPGASAAHFHIK